MLCRVLSLFVLCCLGLLEQTPPGASTGVVPSATRTLVWGSGLQANVVLPARFFYIQTVDSSGRNFTSSPGENTFEVKIMSPVEQFTRIWVQVLDRKDGSFLPSGSVWKEDMHCPVSFPQIEQDLALFPRVDPDRNALEVPQQFFVNLGDWPLEKRRPSERLHPIFSWCGSNDTRDVVMPTYDLTEVSLDMMSVQANTGPPWREKNATAFWRGRDSRKERLELVKLARAHPDMVDAAFTNFFFFKHDESLYGPLVKHVSFFDFFKYKYQINIDGTVAAYRLPYLLAGDSVVLKQDSGYYEHFYSQLRPWVHYIPIRADLADLQEKIHWAREQDEEARKIAVAGQQFARNHLMGDSIFCYYYKLFQEYAKLQVTEPKVREGMERVEQPTDDLFPCSCHRIPQ
ncbi:unnamed protein product, partial [Coregonus sp. 'balchen']